MATHDDDRSARERFHDRTPTLRQQYAKATEYVPGGSRWAVLHFDPVCADHAEGSWLTPLDGNGYFDLPDNSTPLVHGRTPNESTGSAGEVIARGSTPGTPTEAEVDRAEHLVE